MGTDVFLAAAAFVFRAAGAGRGSSRQASRREVNISMD
jgi:hypothetical protein